MMICFHNSIADITNLFRPCERTRNGEVPVPHVRLRPLVERVGFAPGLPSRHDRPKGEPVLTIADPQRRR